MIKYRTGPGSNSRPLDLQSDSHLLPDMLPTALRGPVSARKYIGQLMRFRFCFVCFDSLSASEQFFSHISTGLPEKTTQ